MLTTLQEPTCCKCSFFFLTIINVVVNNYQFINDACTHVHACKHVYVCKHTINNRFEDNANVLSFKTAPDLKLQLYFIAVTYVVYIIMQIVLQLLLLLYNVHVIL